LDPRSRTELWDTIRERVARGTTVLLTTQYLEEADQLADDIVVIDHGRAIARGTAEELKRQVGGEHLDVTVRHTRNIEQASSTLKAAGTGTVRVDVDSCKLSVPVSSGIDALRQVLKELETVGIEVIDIALRRPTIDDVFMKLTSQDADPNTILETPL
jgi:ABC-2 type transport system ATP-binding protein